jgi:flavoprotein hydroxylase
VFLAGDAAHQMPPFAGQGMCAGVRDAANLAWKLDLAIDGRATDALLDTYAQERLPSARQAIEFSMELGKVICVPDADEAAARDAAMAASVTADLAEAPELPGVEGGVIDPASPDAGRLFVQGTDAGEPFDTVHGTGWRLVTVDLASDAIDPEARTWFATIAGRIVPLAAPDAVHRRWFTEHDARAVLVRPDFHVYGTAVDPAGTGELLHALRRHLTRDPVTEGVPS